MRIRLLRHTINTTTTMRFGFLNRLRLQTSRLALFAAPAAATAHWSSSARLDAAAGAAADGTAPAAVDEGGKGNDGGAAGGGVAQHFDYLVIGGGSGGVASARRAASYGVKVCMYVHLCCGWVGGWHRMERFDRPLCWIIVLRHH